MQNVASLDFATVETGGSDLLFHYPGERRLEDRVLDVLRVLGAACSLEGVDCSKVRFHPSDSCVQDEFAIVEFLRREGWLVKGQQGKPDRVYFTSAPVLVSSSDMPTRRSSIRRRLAPKASALAWAAAAPVAATMVSVSNHDRFSMTTPICLRPAASTQLRRWMRCAMRVSPRGP